MDEFSKPGGQESVPTINHMRYIVLAAAAILALVVLSWQGLTLVGIAGATFGVAATYSLFALSNLSRRKPAPPPTAACARCGYDLRHLQVPRCPECGALFGFEKSAEELGIEPEINSKPRRGEATADHPAAGVGMDATQTGSSPPA